MAPKTTDYSEIQQNEIEALRSIYMEDFTEDAVKAGAWNKTTDRSLRLRLKPLSGEHDEVTVTLMISLPATYPKTLPKVNVSYGEGVRPKAKVAVDQLLNAKPKTLLGSEMIFELAGSIQDILEDAAQLEGQSVPTLDEERVSQEATAIKLAQEAQQQKLKEQRDACAEEERALFRMVEQEQARLAAKRKSKPPAAAEGSMAEEEVFEGTQFDQSITIKTLEGKSINLRTVDRKVKFCNGPVTNISTVHPAGFQEDSPPFLLLRESVLEFSENENDMKKGIQVLESKLEDVMRLSSHPNVYKPLSFRILRGVADDSSKSAGWTISVLTEFAIKGSLRGLLETVGTLGVDSTFRSWAIQLIEALDFCHRNGIVHGRVRLQNILLDRAETATTIVRLSEGAYQQQLHLLKGQREIDPSAASAFWSAPELGTNLHGNLVSATDIWDLGVVFLQMLFGLDVQKQYPSPTALIEDLSLSDSLEDLLRQMFRADAKKRPTAFDLLPCEFLRNNDPVLEQRPWPSASRELSSASFTPSKTPRVRHDSTNFSTSSSRYANDFVEAGRLGRGGFGEVVRARNKLDGHFYAVKKITQASASALSGVLSEIILLSRLNHPNVVRYFTAWIEDEGPREEGQGPTCSSEDESISALEDSDIEFGHSTGGLDFISSSGFPKVEFGYDSGEDVSSSEAIEDDGSSSEEDTEEHRRPHGGEQRQGPGTGSTGANGRLRYKRSFSHVQSTRTTLFIQMEYCENKTLRDIIKGDLCTNNEECWRLFRQTLEGLAHIHKNGIIHRDLKPENIFIDVSNNVRIGDFGLARPGEFQALNNPPATDSVHPELTKSVGTAFYVAPEVRSSSGGIYNEKADMYSLGIILFEMCVPLKTGMERVQTLSQIREKNYSLPSLFEDPEKSTQGDIINSLISHKPAERPTSSELLRSGKVLVQIEDETIRTALRGISDTTSPYYSKLMDAIFSQPTSDLTVKDHTYDIATLPKLAVDDLILQRMVKDKLSTVFRRHGAVETSRPILLPYSAYYSNTAVRLLDSSGTVVQLPYDLTLPNARILAKQPSQGQKTYAFGDVYRDAPAGGHPRSHGEVDFDIVSYDNFDLALREAETIKVIDEVIDAFPSLGAVQMCYHINHSRLLDCILDLCSIDTLKRPAVKETISKLHIGQWTWAKVRNELRSPSLAVASTSLDDLMRFDFRDTYEKAIPRLRSIFPSTEDLDPIFSHLQAVVTYLRRFNVKRKVYINPLSSFNDKFYQGNLLFQCIYDSKRRDVFAAGGRYDRLIQTYQTSTRSSNRHAVGFNLGWEKLFSSMSRYLRNLGKSFLKGSEEESGTQWYLRRCDVLVDSFDATTLRSTGIKVLGELWAHDISAELSIDSQLSDNSSHQNKEVREGYSWIVTIKQDKQFKVRSMINKDEQDIRSSDLISHLRSEIRERDRHEGRPSERTKLLRQASQPDSANLLSDREPNVQVLVSQKGKRGSRRNVVEDAQTRTQELVRSFLDGPIAAIEVKDDLFDGIRNTRLSDPDSWRRFIQGAPLADRAYLGQVHSMLTEMAGDAQLAARNAFIYNFRTRACILYDLGRLP